MSWLARIQNKPREEKIRLIWIIIIAVAVVLIVLWALTSKIPDKLPKDASIFRTFGNGVSNIREQYNK